MKCPYCKRDDFVDKVSLNRHLSYNRQCSKADIEATDKLSIIRYDSNLSQHLPSDNSRANHQTYYADVMHKYEGNLVNIANSIEMYAIYQRQTSLNPSAMKGKQAVVTLTHNSSCAGADGLDKTVIAIDKEFLSNLTNGKIEIDNLDINGKLQLPKDNLDKNILLSNAVESNKDSDKEDDVHNPYSDDDNDGDDFVHENDAESSQAFIAEADEEYENEGEVNEPGQLLENALPQLQVPFHGGSKQLDCLADLYMMLDKRGVANSLFDQITQWAWLNASTFGRNPPMKRDTVVHKVFSHVRGPDYKAFMTPRQEILQLSTGRHVAISYFPLENMIKDMLNNKTLMAPENLLFSDCNNPSVDGPNLRTFGDVNTGFWWQCAKHHDCVNHNDVLWPLILFIDGMKVDNLAGKLRLEPISFTFSRFHRWVRHQDNAWRTWAYIEDVKQPVANVVDDSAISPKDRLQEYHDILAFLMKDLKRIQDNGIPWELDLGGGRVHKVVLRMPLQFIIGDCEGHDKLIGRFKGHTQNIKGLCRDCDIPSKHADNENWVCTFFNEEEMQHLTKEDLREYSFHDIHSGLHGVSVGGSPRGIRELLNPEILHLFSSGHCEWVSDGYTFSLSTNSTKKTNKASGYFVRMYRGQSDRSYPNIGTFRDGLTTQQGTNLQAHEKNGRVFFIYLLLCCSDYVSMLDNNRKKGSTYNLAFYGRFVEMLEHCLGFFEWSKLREHDKDTVLGNDGTPESSKAQRSARRYMSLLKRSCPRVELGKNFKMVKFHQTLHMVDAITRHGSLLNIDSGRPESMAKGNVKDPASHTQRNTSTLSFQTGKRYIESLTFREYKRLKAELNNSGGPDDCDVNFYLNRNTKEAQLHRLAVAAIPLNNEQHTDPPLPGGTKFMITVDHDAYLRQYQVDIQWMGQGDMPLGMWDDDLVQKIGQRLFMADDGGTIVEDEIPGFTAVKYGDIIYNANPR